MLLIAMTLTAYIPALRGGFVWDDKEFVVENQTLRTWDGLKKIWLNPRANLQYFPVSFTSFWIDYHLWGKRTTGYHVHNVLLHALNGILLWRLLRSLRVSGAWFAGALFALHPVHVEPVAWITERKDVLSGAFFLLTLLAWSAFMTKPNWTRYFLALGLFIPTLLAKTSTVPLPAVLLLGFWWRKSKISMRDAMLTIPFFAMSLGVSVLHLWVERGNIGAASEELSFPFPTRALIAGRALWFYALKNFWPINLMPIYPRWELDRASAWAWLFPLLAIAAATALWLRRSYLPKGPLAAFAFFVLMALPVLGFFSFAFFRLSFVGDHLQYLSSLGWCALMAASAPRVWTRVTQETMYGMNAKKLEYGLTSLVLLMFGTGTWLRAETFRDSESLWRDNLRQNRASWTVENNLTQALGAEDKLDEALLHAQAAVQLDPRQPEALGQLAAALARKGKLDEAVKYALAALEIWPFYFEAQYTLGTTLLQQGKTAEAIEHLRLASRTRPDNAKIHHNLAVALDRQQNGNEALLHYTEAVRLEPENSNYRNNFAMALVRENRIQEGIEEFSAALALNPSDAEIHNNLGVALELNGQKEEAIAHYQESLRLRPDYEEARINLKKALEEESRSQFSRRSSQ